MKRRLTLSLKLLALVAILVITFASCQSGSQPDKGAATSPPPVKPTPLPHMWTDDPTSRADESLFLMDLNPKLQAQIGHKETDSIYYTKDAFDQMINYCLNVPGVKWIDIYPVVPSTPPPGDTLSLLFVPKDNQFNPLRYVNVRSNAPSFIEKDDTIDPKIAPKWIQNYAARIAKLDGLDKSDPANYIHCNTNYSKDFSNTIYLHHPKKDFVELDAEFTIQPNQYSKSISGVKAFFAAKANKVGGPYTLSNRLYAILEFTIEDDKNYPHRIFSIWRSDRPWPGPSLPPTGKCKPPDSSVGKNSLVGNLMVSGNNNGQMCPPSCNP
jgi:hypothetical protein